MSRIAGKVVAITGASSGIGEATARVLAERGAKVVLGARRVGAARRNRRRTARSRRTGRRLRHRRHPPRRSRAARRHSRGGVRAPRCSGEQRRHQQDRPDGRPRRRGLVGDDRRQPQGRAARYCRGASRVSATGQRALRHHGLDRGSERSCTTWAVYAATKNAVRTVLEGLRQESTDGVVRTTAVSPGFVNTELDSSIDNATVREQIRRNMDAFGIPPEAVAEAIAFAVDQPSDVEIGEITVRPTVQN